MDHGSASKVLNEWQQYAYLSVIKFTGSYVTDVHELMSIPMTA